ncbi:hypothetical protein [Flavobacterium okayamense]|uniref:Uncharacterized protein n=1 Tax=Flavobacterium okayamense TaxID=2830782 RepID=A0ABM7S6E4_9FLAO|nr:hypothetical protein [Flavobacterium okayamense]BCY29042.1 hypothetical protein KK2020170_19100 [Flavobacterium okayamense]
MKKIILIAFIALFAFTGSAQKTKKVTLGKVDNLTAEVVPNGKGKKLLLQVKNGSEVETLDVKSVADNNLNPKEFIMKSFSVNEAKFYVLTWKEQITTQTKLKKEVADITESQIWNIETSTLLLGNTQKSIYIKETQFLDKNKTASHEVEKKRNEGFEFILNNDGSVVLKTKTQENHYKFNFETGRYEPSKAVVTAKSNTKKKR